jgi:pectate lyase
MHQNTNLIGYSDREPKGFLNTTYAFNWWGDGCRQRMPMARIGKVHMLNNYFSSTTASNCINPRISSEVLIEGNYFEKGVKRYYSQKEATAVTWTDTNFAEEKNKMGQPTSVGEQVTVPYEYTIVPATDIPAVIKNNAGATIK